MRQKSETSRLSSEQVVEEIRRATRKQYSAGEKIRSCARSHPAEERIIPWPFLASVESQDCSQQKAGRRPSRMVRVGSNPFASAPAGKSRVLPDIWRKPRF